MGFTRTNAPALLAALSLSWLAIGLCSAQQYPARPIRMIVGFATGGATDISARVLAHALSETVGQQVVVENRPGAASMLAAEVVARSAPDGYTLLFVNATIAMPSLFKKLSFDVQKDLQPVSLAGYGPLVLTVHPSLPVKSVTDLVTLAKRRPGELNYASAGPGSFTHLAMALFVLMTDTNIVHVPYKGGGPSAIATMIGETQITFSSIGSSLSQIKQGKLRALGVSGMKRNIALPHVPTVSEAGVAGYDATSWYGMLAPSGTPSAIIAKLSESAMKALTSAELRHRLLRQGIEPATGGIDEFAPHLKKEIAKWAKVIGAARIPAQ